MVSMSKGFTLLELMVVVSVIIVIGALTFPLVSRLMGQGQEGRTRQVIGAIQAAIASYPTQTFENESRQIRRLWDANGDGILDGIPDREPAFSPLLKDECRRVGYVGIRYNGGISAPSSMIDSESGRIVDAWGNPLRIAFATGAYASSWFGIWSLGEDGTDRTADDLKSWVAVGGR
jgi:prepilin-type N-terminal cleavage/methylation domain-containing protein